MARARRREAETSEQPTAAPGRLNYALANAVVRVHREVVGRGPTRAQAFYRDNVVVVVLRDSLTTAERNLMADGRDAAVLGLRREVQAVMRARLVEAVERLTGASVNAFMSANHLNPDLMAELFVLDRPPTP